MIHDARSAAEKSKSDIHQYNTNDFEMIVTLIESESKTITVTQKAVLKALLHTTVLVSAKAAGLREVISHENVTKINACSTANAIMNVYPSCPFYITSASLGKVDVNMLKHQKVEEVANVLQEIDHLKDQCFSYRSV